MASKTTGRSLHNAIKRVKPTCECASLSYPRNASIRQLSASTNRRNDVKESERPKWSYTPDRMKAPMPWKPINPEKRWKANEDPIRLDKFYNTFLGRGGEMVLPDDVKWLAVTHKSFDQGRRGFNDRLAFLGMSPEVERAIIY
jgi:large subunit ribosomal protein L15